MDIRVRRSWMYNRLLPDGKDFTKEFMVGLNEFMDFAKAQPQFLREKTLRCPCNKDKNRSYEDPENVRTHLLRYGFQPDYWYWTKHGEHEDPTVHIGASSNSTHSNMDERWFNSTENYVYDAMGQNIELNHDTEMNQNREDPPNADAQRFYDLLSAANRPLWDGCESYSELSVALEMMCIKSDFNESQACFNRWAQLLKSSNPSANLVPKHYYNAKKLVKRLGLTSVTYDCCVKGCMLYFKADANLSECKFCGHARYKPTQRGRRKPIPYKTMHYMPLIPRLKRLYASLKSAAHMRWHSEHTREPGVMCHPSDGLAWKHFDEAHPDFAADPRNIRLGLCTDGFNPFDHSSNKYSIWPVVVTPYNLPPEMCMTTPYMFLNCLIPGKDNPKMRIDVYLQPLIDELKVLWTEGVETYDVSLKQNFQMKAALMWTINDFPAYAMLSGWSTAGKLACPICMEDTNAFRLEYGNKQSWFDCHRPFLPSDHQYRRNKDAFYRGRRETSDPPLRLSGQQVWERVREIPKITDLPVKHSKIPGQGRSHNWCKQSIFWELPYWKDNLVRHNLDVMHIEKNIFDNVFNTVMNIKDKTKDNENARMDLIKHCKRPELHLRKLPNGKSEKPKAIFTLSDDERRDLCKWVESLKMPDGYASNLARCVDKTNHKLHGMKSHDCHVFMQRLLPIALSTLPQNVWKPLTELSQFFRELCSTELHEENLRQLERNIPVILCKLERIFPPAFFDSMEHLPIHLPYEALMCGPVQYRWMYPFERYIHDLKGMVKNKAKVEGSICQSYLSQESAYFSSYYFASHIESKSTKSKRNEVCESTVEFPRSLSIFNQSARPFGKCTTRDLTDSEQNKAALLVLLNCDEVLPILETYRKVTRYYYGNLTDQQVEDSIEMYFVRWFREYVQNPKNGVKNNILLDMSYGPKRQVNTWAKVFVNGYLFHVDSLTNFKKTCNSGVSVKGHDSSEYFGVLEEVIQLEYNGLPEKKVVLFNCRWFDTVSHRGIRRNDQYGLIEIKINESYPKNDPFILAQHASQVYYVPYPGTRRHKVHWRFVVKTRPRSRVAKSHSMEEPLQDLSTNVNPVVDEDQAGELVDHRGRSEEVNTIQIEENEQDEEEDREEDEIEEQELEDEEETKEELEVESENEEEEDDDENDEEEEELEVESENDEEEDDDENDEEEEEEDEEDD